MINATIAYVAVQTDLTGKAISLVPWTALAPIGAGWQMSNGLMVLCLIALDLVLYYPFFKIYEKQLLKDEMGDSESATDSGDLQPA